MLTYANFKWQVLITFFAEELLEESWAPRSADMPVSTGKTTTSQKDPPETVRTQEMRSSLGQDPSGSCLCLDLILGYSTWSWTCATVLYTQISLG